MLLGFFPATFSATIGLDHHQQDIGMKQLGILDSAFINLEHPNTPQHIGGFGIYDPSTSPDGFVRFKQVMANVEQRLKDLPVFRTRLVEVPMGLDKPYWVIDDNFDVEFHLRHIALPSPGDWRQLCIQVARLHARPLDMSRPLWECYIIEGLHNIHGLPEGAFAIYTKMHHSLIDGAGSQSFMAALHDLEANPEPEQEQNTSTDEITAAEQAFAPANLSTAEMLRKATLNNLTSTLSMAKGAVNVAGDLLSTISRIRKDELPAFPLDAPKTRFDEPISPHRVFDAASFSLDDFKAIRHMTDTTINDVAVAVVSGALRKYLGHHGELPEVSLASSMPVNTRTRKTVTEDNNQVSAMMSLIHTDIEDPIERLQAIGNSLTDAKKLIDTPLADPIKIAGVFNPWLAKSVANWYIDHKITNSLPMGTCSVITNVMGPPFPLFSAGAKLVEYYCLGLLTPGGGLFHAVFSMNGKVSISSLACRTAMPDPEFYKQCIVESFDELKEAAEKKYGRKKSTKKPKIAPSKKQPAKKKFAAKKATPVKASKKKPAAKKKTTPLKAVASNKEVALKKRAGVKSTAVAKKNNSKKTTEKRQSNQGDLF